MSTIIKIYEHISIMVTDYYMFGRKTRKKRMLFTKKYENELKKKFREHLSNDMQYKGKNYGE